MLVTVRYVAALLLMLVFGLVSCLASWLLSWWVEHVFETVFHVLPDGQARYVMGAIVSHARGGRCWRCGERAPTLADVLHRHHPPGPPAAP
jgi:hypothetical protein